MDTVETIVQLSRQLYPPGRAFAMPTGGDLEALHRALAQSEARAWNDAMSILDSILPDNDNFTEDDATDWERRLGIYSGTGTSLADRKLAILRKINHPGTVKARQNYLYLQNQLRAAGFDVYVYENIFDDGGGGFETRTPGQILAYAVGYASIGGFSLGEVNLNDTWGTGIGTVTVAANHLEESRDADFSFGDNWRSSFFIAGAAVDEFAEVEEVRKIEFRQLILRIKPVASAGILFVNYV